MAGYSRYQQWQKPQETRIAINTSEEYYEWLKQTTELHALVKKTTRQMKADFKEFKEKVEERFQDSWKASFKNKWIKFLKNLKDLKELEEN